MTTRFLVGLFSFALCFQSAVETAWAAGVRDVIQRAKRAVESGSVDPARDLAPLIEALRTARSEDDKEDLVDAIEDLGRGDGTSPAAVKSFLLEQATPLFLEIGRSAQSVFLRGGVFLSLRNMGASRAVLEQAAAIAEADPDAYVQSRGEILRNFIQSMPAESVVSDVRPADPDKERRALQYLKGRRLGASAEQLRVSALQGDSEAVQALLDAGVDVNAGDASQNALTAAVFSGCGAKGGEDESLVETVKILLAAGADVSTRDDNDNTPLIPAAQMCGPQIVTLLIDAGAEINLKNGSGISPLAMALILGKFDSAEVLVQRGARLDPGQTEMLTASASDPRAKDIIRRASRK